LKKAVTDLESTNKELEKFAYVASHDLQEPLRMIGSFTQLLAKRYKGKLDKDADEFISYAVEGANRMHQLINDLLTYSRLTSKVNDFIPVDCNIVVEKVISNLKTLINECDARIKFDKLPVIIGDESQITQLFQNLINNAIKFHKEGKPEIFISGISNENEWQFSVADNGIGIDPAYHERVFIIFQRLNSRSNYMGTGMGLAICKKIVELHGGRIWVESQLNQGSTFYFTISKKKGFKND
jgi:light-regulated signal transduction histidine kinase (bacteriophytochrome)